MHDLWDGRLIYYIFAHTIANKPILPYRLQAEFSTYHQRVGLFNEALVTDQEDALISPASDADQKNGLLINECTTFPIENQFYKTIFAGDNALASLKYKPPEDERNTEGIFRKVLNWRFHTVEDRLLQLEPKVELSAWEQRKFNRQRQNMSKWLVNVYVIFTIKRATFRYQAFSDSLEGRGNDLLVDFSRVPKMPAVVEEPAQENGDEKTAKGGKKAAGGAPKKEAAANKKGL